MIESSGDSSKLLDESDKPCDGAAISEEREGVRLKFSSISTKVIPKYSISTKVLPYVEGHAQFPVKFKG
jgi:hypothetical protein